MGDRFGVVELLALVNVLLAGLDCPQDGLDFLLFRDEYAALGDLVSRQVGAANLQLSRDGLARLLLLEGVSGGFGRTLRVPRLVQLELSLHLIELAFEDLEFDLQAFCGHAARWLFLVVVRVLCEVHRRLSFRLLFRLGSELPLFFELFLGALEALFEPAGQNLFRGSLGFACF